MAAISVCNRNRPRAAGAAADSPPTRGAAHRETAYRLDREPAGASTAARSPARRRALPTPPSRSARRRLLPRRGIDLSAARLLDHRGQRRDKLAKRDWQIEKLVSRQARMCAPQPVPKHFGEWLQPLTAQSLRRDARKLRHIVGDS